MRRGTAKDALTRLRWKQRVQDWSEVEITVRHHGAPGDRKDLGGMRVTGLGTSFFEIDGETSIPYHRILRIRWRKETVYERAGSSPSKDS